MPRSAHWQAATRSDGRACYQALTPLLRVCVSAAGRLIFKERTAHLAEVVGDDDVQAWTRGAVVAYGDDRDAVPCPLRAEFIIGELGRQPA
jgi:hypothetical protein